MITGSAPGGEASTDTVFEAWKQVPADDGQRFGQYVYWFNLIHVVGTGEGWGVMVGTGVGCSVGTDDGTGVGSGVGIDVGAFRDRQGDRRAETRRQTEVVVRRDQNKKRDI